MLIMSKWYCVSNEGGNGNNTLIAAFDAFRYLSIADKHPVLGPDLKTAEIYLEIVEEDDLATICNNIR